MPNPRRALAPAARLPVPRRRRTPATRFDWVIPSSAPEPELSVIAKHILVSRDFASPRGELDAVHAATDVASEAVSAMLLSAYGNAVR